MNEISFTGIIFTTLKAYLPSIILLAVMYVLCVCALLIRAAKYIMDDSFLTLNIVVEI